MHILFREEIKLQVLIYQITMEVWNSYRAFSLQREKEEKINIQDMQILYSRVELYVHKCIYCSTQVLIEN